MTKIYAVYTLFESDERFLGQSYLTEEDLKAIDQSFAGQLQGEYFITLTHGELVNINLIDSIEEITEDEE